MRNATPRVADTGEMKAGQTYQLIDLTTKSKAAAHARQGARVGFRLAFGALALSALATFTGLTTSARAAGGSRKAWSKAPRSIWQIRWR